jgi:hypothetical protein
MRKQIVGGIIVMAVGLSALGMGGCNKKDEVLASVGKQKITLSEFNLALANLPDSYKVLATTFKGKRQILDNLVKKSLLVQDAEDRGLQKGGDLKKRIKELQTKSRGRIKQQMADLQRQLDNLDQQVYENVLLTELNSQLKKDSAGDKEIGDTDIQTYYEDYTRKLQLLNPAAKVPDISVVSGQIRAILVEEKLIKSLEKKCKVAVEEEKFQKLFGDATDVTIQDNAGH